MNIRKLFLFIALFLSIFGFSISIYAQGGDDPIPGIDIIIKENCGPNENQPCGFTVNLYVCADGSTVSSSAYCKEAVATVKYMKIDGIDGEAQDEIAEAIDAMWLCDNGDIVGRPQDCKDNTEFPALFIEEEKYHELLKQYEEKVKSNGGFPCYDGTIVNDPDDCKDILPVQEQAEKIEGIDGEVSDEDSSDDATTKQGGNDPVPGIDVIVTEASVTSPTTLYRCEDGTVIEFGESCPPTIMKAQAEKIDGIDDEISDEDSSDDATTKQGGNDPVPGIDVIVTEASVTSPTTLYRCEDGTVVEDSVDCGSQIGMVKYKALGTYSSDGLDRLTENVTIANSVHICDDGSQVSLPSECDDTSEYDTIIYVPADDFYTLHEAQEKGLGGAIYVCPDGTVIDLASEECRGSIIMPKARSKDDASSDEDSSDNATTKQGGNDPIPGIDIIVKKCKPYPECGKTVVGDTNLSPEEIRAEKRQAQREQYQVQEVKLNKYKKAFNAKLEKVLPKIPEEKFDEILERIDTMLEKTETNTKLTGEKRETLLSAILAIRELIEDAIDE